MALARYAGSQASRKPTKQTISIARAQWATMASADWSTRPGSEVARLQAEVERLREELAQQRDKARAFFERLERVQAEFEEYRNQAQKDMDAMREASKRELILRMLDVMDSMDRAIELAGGDEALHEGLTHILRQMRAILEREGVKRIETEGLPFKPELHELVMREDTSEYRDETVIKELGRGYTLGGKVLRRAKVKVASNRP